MEAAIKTEIHARVLSQIAEKNLSDADAAKQIGMSASYLWHIRHNKWDSISDTMWMKAATWCGYSFNRWATASTPQLNSIVNLLLDAQENCRMMAIASPTGIGKTTGINYYYQSARNTYKVLCTVTMSRKDFLRAVQEAMGIDQEGSLHSRIESIIEKLNSAPNSLLILDDVGKLNDGCLRLIQVIYDRTEGRCGIVLAGTEQLKKYIFKMASKDKLGFRELKRRIAYWETLMPVSQRAVETICKQFNIQDKDCISFCMRTCNNYGTLRELLVNANRMAIKEQCAITLDILENVHVGESQNLHIA